MVKRKDCSLSRYAILVLIMGVTALLFLPVPVSARMGAADPWLEVIQSRPADLACSLKPFIGDYGSSLIVREEAGGMQLVRGRELYDLQQAGGLTFACAGSGAMNGKMITFEPEGNGFSPALHLGGERLTRDAPALRISPLKPVDALRAEALAAKPPVQKEGLYSSDLVEVTAIDPSIRLDIRYATANNFMGVPFYSQARAFLQRPAAEAVVRVHRRLREHGLGLLIYDAYRPWYVTKMFWEATPQDKRNFVADPAQGSRHNRGSAVDLTIVDRTTGRPLDMGGAYDEFSSRSFIDYPGGTSLQRWNRHLLQALLESENFTVFHDEWWHFDYKDRDKYPILDITFEQIGRK